MKYELNRELSHELEESHEHLHEHYNHQHVHDPKEKKRQINRLARIIGHLQKVKQMLEDDEDCADVLLQLSASKSALNGLGKEIINDHISHCIIHAVEDGDETALNEFKDAIQKFM
ncbi:MAG: metal-sensing transcriptional repressor [Lachnospiraceae bacterium]|nr:metal-sensing transcriptional repressor [Lachnospiraceae bacterium]